MQQKIIQIIKNLVIVSILVLGVIGVQAGTWTAAPVNPPTNNVDAPLNTGAIPQAKNGSVIDGSLLNIAGTLTSNNFITAGSGYFGNGIQIPLNAASGNVLTSDSQGNGTWQASASVPTGAVMAFNLTSCPTGWSQFAPASGRTIIGTGSGNTDENGVSLSQRALGNTGGAETHLQVPAEIAPFKLQINGFERGDDSSQKGTPYVLIDDQANQDAYSALTRDVIFDTSDNAVGPQQAMDIMNPYISLLYCQKGSGSYTGPLAISTAGMTMLGGSAGELPSGKVNQSYSFQLSATGGVPPYTWVVTAGQFLGNNSISLSNSGLISGTPSMADPFAIYNATVTVTDSVGSTSNIQLEIPINPIN